MTDLIEPKNCLCGGLASIKHTTYGYRVCCNDCGKYGKTDHEINSAIRSWNEIVCKPDSYRSILCELEGHYCRGWCNQDYCSTTDCPIYGLRKRRKMLDEVSE